MVVRNVDPLEFAVTTVTACEVARDETYDWTLLESNVN
jgi:hypothetical protein